MPSDDKSPTKPTPSALDYVQAWGLSPLPPTLLATFITALHFRPFGVLPMAFPPVLLFSTYLNLSSYKIDAAGLTAAWSGLYILLASRRRATGSLRARIGKRFGARGWVRGAAMGVAAGNVLACGGVYAIEKREEGGL